MVGQSCWKRLVHLCFIPVLMCLFFSPTGARAGTIYFQGFENADPPDLPQGCSVEILWEPSRINWATRRFGWAPYGVLPHSGSVMAYFNSGSVEIGGARLVLDGPLDLRGYSEAVLSIWVYHDNQRETFDLINLQVSTDGGTNWQFVGDEILRYSTEVGWKEEIIDLSAFAGNPAVLIGIRGLSYFGNDIHVDDISVTASGELDETQGEGGAGGCRAGSMDPLFLLFLVPLAVLSGRRRREEHP